MSEHIWEATAIAGWVMLWGCLLVGLFFCVVIAHELIRRRGDRLFRQRLINELRKK